MQEQQVPKQSVGCLIDQAGATPRWSEIVSKTPQGIRSLEKQPNTNGEVLTPQANNEWQGAESKITENPVLPENNGIQP